MANTVLKPAVVDFIEFATKTGNMELQIEEVIVSPGSKVANSTLKDTGIGRDLGIIIVAIKRSDGTMQFNPGSVSKIQSGDTMVALGETSRLKELGDPVSGATG